MQHLFQSPFLQALGYAITNSLWQAALVWLLFILLNSLLKLNAANKYRLAVGAQFVIFAWFLVTLQFYANIYRNDTSPGLVNGARLTPLHLTTDGSFQSYLISWLVKAEQLLPYLSVAYLALMCFLCIRWFIGYRQTQLIRTTGLSKMPANWRIFTENLAAQLGVSRKVQVFLSETVQTPLTIGFLKPLILVPVASINHLSTEQLEAVILHEMAHIKRYDYLLNIILSVVEISLFFNPFTQLLGKQIKKERENSCDDWVLQFQYNAATYAGALLQIARLQTVSSKFAMAAAGNKQDLLGRVKRMIDPQENHFTYRKQLLAFCMVTLILSSIAWLNPDSAYKQPSGQTSIKGNMANTANIQPVAAEPMTIKIANPLFNPIFFLSEPLKKKMQKDMEQAAKEIQAASNEVASAVPVIVSDALQTASNELSTLDLGKTTLSGLEQAKIALGKKNYFDTSLLLNAFRYIPGSEDLQSSLKKIQDGIEKAKIELHDAGIIQKQQAVAMLAGDQKARKDIENALIDLEKLKLGNIITTALQQVQLPEILIKGDKDKQIQIRLNNNINKKAEAAAKTKTTTEVSTPVEEDEL